MKTIIIFLRRIFKSLYNLWDKPYSIQLVEDPVDNAKKKTLYIIGSAEEPFQVELLCPCGCKDKIVLPVNYSTKPRWTLSITNRNLPSLSPSVWRSKGCKSHFFLKQGKIDWC